jgi:hypothetical protein
VVAIPAARGEQDRAATETAALALRAKKLATELDCDVESSVLA